MDQKAHLKQVLLEYIDKMNDKALEFQGVIAGTSEDIWLKGFAEPYREDNPHVLYSISKSFACLALGLLYDDGLVNLHKPLIEYYPEYQDLAKGYMKEVTLHHLLAMNAGTDTATTGRICTHGKGDDWTKNFFSDDLVWKPGTHFQYNTPGSYMIARTVRKISNQKALDLLKDRIFRPMEIEDTRWEECPLGNPIGGWGLWMKPIDLFKIGQLILKKGMWNGKQLISKEWIELMAKKYSDTDHLNDPTECGYGYQVWHNVGGGISFRGMFGQYCIMIPEKDCVIVLHSSNFKNTEHGEVIGELLGKIPDLHGYDKVKAPEILDGLYFPPLPTSKSVRFSDGQHLSYKMEANKEGYEWIEMAFYKDYGILTLKYSQAEGGYVNNLPFSYGKWSYGTRVCREHINFWSGGSKKVAVCAQWEDENIRFKMRFYECCDEETWNCRLEDDKLQIERRLNCADHNATIKETLYGVKK